MEALDRFEILRHEARLEDEVLRRVTADRQFRSEDQFRVGRGESLVGGEDLFKVTSKIADNGIDLRNADPHASPAG